MKDLKVISLGGSIVAPDTPDTDFIQRLKTAITTYLQEDENRKLILIIGGGGPARIYQEAFRKLHPVADSDQQDWIGIMATRLNAELIKGVFSDYCQNPVVTDPTAPEAINGRIMVAAGWKPGFSTDNDAVLLAERFGADTVINLSNISKVYSDDPKTNPDAVPLDHLTWDEFKAMVGTEWTPGKNLPFDPVATGKAAELGLKVITAGGRDIPNLENLLREKEFNGSVIGPE